MAVRSAYTLEEARSRLQLWKACELELASGQAKSYRIGSREFTALDLDEIAKRINYFAGLVDILSGNARSTRVVRIVPRDL